MGIETLTDMLGQVTRERAARPAVVERGQTLTYGELGARVAGLAAELERLGVQTGDRVGLLLPNGADFVIAYFAILSAGGLVVPFNDHYQELELLRLVKECGVSLLVTWRERAELCERVCAKSEQPCRPVYVEDHAGATAPWSPVPIVPNSPVMYQFSSGSTGRPKRITRTHTNLLFELQSFKRTLGITAEDRFIGVAPFSHVNGLMRSMMASLYSGATLYPLQKFEREAVTDLIARERLTVFIAVPMMFSLLAKTRYDAPPDLSSLRLCISASAPMPPKLNRQFYDNFGLYVRQLYGSTETGTISVNLSDDIANTLESVGTPIEGVAVDVFCEDGSPAGPNELGEFAVKSPAAITGYVGLDEVNRQTFRDGYFFTGDLGRKDAAGLLYLVGRKKFFINKGGYKIDPREIEELLESHPNVEEVVVLGLPTPYGDEKIKAVVVVNQPTTEAKLIEFCRGKIADFKVPALVEFRPSLPRGAAGKILREQLM